MNVRTLIPAATLAALVAVLVGCGSPPEDTKPPEGANYYKGDMKPKGGAPTGAAKAPTTD